MPTIAEQLREEGRVEGIEQGIEQGMEQGELIGQIRALQKVLGHTVGSRSELMKFDIQRLQRTAARLAADVFRDS